METALEILVGLAALMLLGLGTLSMFAPLKMVGNFALQPEGIPGLSTIRSVMGGLFLASVAMLALGLVGGKTEAFLPVAMLMGMVAIGRLVGIVADGFDKAVLPPLIVELVIIAILLGAYHQLGN
ncbi:DUF4345 family protein [Roseibium sp.]|uniref:DUF4345 family protein n=1 Tax=Roseibium sp. TaxID=1936156 RepID=UPI003BAFA958